MSEDPAGQTIFERIIADHEARIRYLERTFTEFNAWAREQSTNQSALNRRLLERDDRNTADHLSLGKEIADLRVAVGRISVRLGLIIAAAFAAVKFIG